MVFHETHLPADDSHEISCLISYFGKKAAKFEIVVCCKLKVALYGLNYFTKLEYSMGKEAAPELRRKLLKV